MTIIQSLLTARDRLADVLPPNGYSLESVSFFIALNHDGTVAGGKPQNIMVQPEKGKPRPNKLNVPQPVKRASGISPNFMFDNSAYVLGVSEKKSARIVKQWQAFCDFHIEAIGDHDDIGLQALVKFLRQWQPEHFESLGWPVEILDQNLIFCLEEDRLKKIWLHDRPAAKKLWQRLNNSDAKDDRMCMITGEPAPIARLHPSIKGVWGAQSSGASIISFNEGAFTSYGHKQGDNAPFSKEAATGYATVLNHFLRKGSKNRMQIGDTSTVFWANGEHAALVEAIAGDALAGSLGDDERELINLDTDEKKVAMVLAGLREGEPLKTLAPDLADGVTFNVLGLAPNAARISIRFWHRGDFSAWAKNYSLYIDDMRIDPPPKYPYIGLWRYLSELAVQEKRENIPPNIAGEWMRAILTGSNYPQQLLAATIGRLRADKKMNGYRAAMLKAVLTRNYKREVSMSLDQDETNKGYILGRLFAVYEYIQRKALGDLNSSLTDKYYSSASATPRRIFVTLDRNSVSHLSKIGKNGTKGRRTQIWLRSEKIGPILELLGPANDPFPISLSLEDQSLFGLGYYHEINEFYRTRDAEEKGDTQNDD